MPEKCLVSGRLYWEVKMRNGYLNEFGYSDTCEGGGVFHWMAILSLVMTEKNRLARPKSTNMLLTMPMPIIIRRPRLMALTASVRHSGSCVIVINSNYLPKCKPFRQTEISDSNHKNMFIKIYLIWVTLKHNFSFFFINCRFHFPHGKPPPAITTETTMQRLEQTFNKFPNFEISRDKFHMVVTMCQVPLYWRLPLYMCTPLSSKGMVDGNKFMDFWRQ